MCGITGFVTTGATSDFTTRAAALATTKATEAMDPLRVLQVSIDSISEDLEMITAACEIYRGHHNYRSEA